jgi:hypothetical protein
VSYGFIGGVAGALDISLGRVLSAARVRTAGLALSARTESARRALSGDLPVALAGTLGRERGTEAMTVKGAVARDISTCCFWSIRSNSA